MMIVNRRNWWAPYLFIAPFVTLFLIFMVYPLVQSIVLAAHQTYGPKTSAYVGLQNVYDLLSDPDFWLAMRNTFTFAAASLLVQLPCSLGLAMLLNRPDVIGRAFWRLIFFAPSLVGLAFMAIMFTLIFEKNTGLLNTILFSLFGFDREFPWLQEYVMLALVIASFWMYTGFNMVYFLAALQNVDKSLIEAAMVDGANPWQRFLNVTLPAIRPIATFVVLLSFIGSLQLFELPYLLLNNSAGPDKQGLTVVMYLYQRGFETGDLGYASAIGWALALILIAAAMFQNWFADRGGAE
ncbi:carbohydrate ABC transporter permease [Mucisphaera calidilacus]|uniref:L-arabinose transport system permease protein AraP n=1 Tax=Mucisphaera calidilacus TaxID=2527982 RepID=A0A518BYI9_9BACT|nr:sugar ABC transporter permease [Mucisphaera calidilacus]QDU72032.1 L-arabinose transport system permease protein AraP [Mucisphaera calidilacus]